MNVLYLMRRLPAVDVPWMEMFFSCQSLVIFVPFQTSCGLMSIPWYPVMHVKPSILMLCGPFHVWMQSAWLVVSLPVIVLASLTFWIMILA